MELKSPERNLGLDLERVTKAAALFAATGITDGALLSGVHYHGREAATESLVLRGETGARRFIRAEHRLKG